MVGFSNFASGLVEFLVLNSNVVFQPFKTQSLELRLRLRCLIGKQTMQMTQAPYIMPFGRLRLHPARTILVDSDPEFQNSK